MAFGPWAFGGHRGPRRIVSMARDGYDAVTRDKDVMI